MIPCYEHYECVIRRDPSPSQEYALPQFGTTLVKTGICVTIVRDDFLRKSVGSGQHLRGINPRATCFGVYNFVTRLHKIKNTGLVDDIGMGGLCLMIMTRAWLLSTTTYWAAPLQHTTIYSVSLDCVDKRFFCVC